MRNEKGFTMLEVVITMFLISVFLLVMLDLMNQSNKMDLSSKEQSLSQSLINPFLDTYASARLDKSNLNEYLIGRMDLTAKANVSDIKGLSVICDNDWVQKDNEITFDFSCRVKGSFYSNETKYTLTKYIFQN